MAVVEERRSALIDICAGGAADTQIPREACARKRTRSVGTSGIRGAVVQEGGSTLVNISASYSIAKETRKASTGERP